VNSLDPIDRHIIAELRGNARIPLTTLATRVGRSRTAVQVRIDRLERDGIIRGYRTELSDEQGGKRPLGAILTIHLKERLSPDRVVTFLKSKDEVMGIYTVTGDADLVVMLSISSGEQLQKICEPIWAMPEVRDTDTRLTLKTHIDR
jgi:Lrp/AsnC family leucine-responsive transcriptional regulator